MPRSTDAGCRPTTLIASTAPSIPARTDTSNDAAAAVSSPAPRRVVDRPASRPVGLSASTSFAAAKYPLSRRKRPIAVRTVRRWCRSNGAGVPGVQTGCSIFAGRPRRSSQQTPLHPPGVSNACGTDPGGGRCDWSQRCRPSARSSGRPVISMPADICRGPSTTSTTTCSPALLRSTPAVARAAA